MTACNFEKQRKELRMFFFFLCFVLCVCVCVEAVTVRTCCVLILVDHGECSTCSRIWSSGPCRYGDL